MVEVRHLLVNISSWGWHKRGHILLKVLRFLFLYRTRRLADLNYHLRELALYLAHLLGLRQDLIPELVDLAVLLPYPLMCLPEFIHVLPLDPALELSEGGFGPARPGSRVGRRTILGWGIGFTLEDTLPPVRIVVRDLVTA